MAPKSPKVFLDTSVIIAAVMSPSGGARLLFHLSHAGVIRLAVGPGILLEAEEVFRRKAPNLLGLLAQLLDAANVEIDGRPSAQQIGQANSLLIYPPDANVLAQAIFSHPDWFVSHDQAHFLDNPALNDLAFRVGTLGDVIAWLREQIE
jgi:predicted nucleic acid-binding protein